MRDPRSDGSKQLAALLFIVLILCAIQGSRAEAMRIIDVPGADGQPFFRYQIYDKGEVAENGETSGFTLNDAEISAIVDGSKYWSTMLTPGALFSEPLRISLVTVDTYDDNASADSDVYGDSGYTKLTAGIRGLPISGILAKVTVDHAQYFSGQWYTEPMSSLPRNGEYSDLPSTLTHELNHAVGLTASVISDDTEQFSSFDTKISLWTQGLRDITGNAARPDQRISAAKDAEPGDFVTRDLTNSPGVYFTGNHVQEVLNGALLAAADDLNVPRVPGLPVNGWESFEDEQGNRVYFPEFSHIELQNSLMSHQAYRNWNILMEAELAAMQDVGLVLDRRNYYGYSLYNDGLSFDNSNPYYARNAEAWVVNAYNPTAYGIGFHVYGSKNTLRQSADILSSGDWGMGIRMDGSGNDLTIAPGVRVHANGYGGNALLVAYGSEHRVSLRGDLQALGTGGTAARFDFGSNELGDLTEYRGSYIRSRWNDEDGTWSYDSLFSALQGPLVESFDVTGRLAGTDAAIYISPNAFVRNINIMSGASLSGAVLSEWDPYNHHVQYTGNHEDLLTSLTFGLQADATGQASSRADPNFRFWYAGDIRGEAGLRLRVAGGLLAYDGNATVRDVTISEGAILGGNGTYTLNPAGTFLNQGTLSPGHSLGDITVNGNYEQSPSGTLVVDFNSAGHADTLRVRGNAAIAGTLALMPARDYYAGSLSLAPLEVSGIFDPQYRAQTVFASPTLTLGAQPQSDQTILVSASREANAYSRYANSDVANAIGQVLSRTAKPELAGDMRQLVATLDFSNPNGTDVRAGLATLAPDVYGNGIAANFDMHRMLSDLLLADMGLRGMRSASSRPDGEWRTFVLPFAGYASRSAHDGLGGFDVSHVGLVGGAERVTAAGLTLGGHVAFNHQNMDNDRSGSLRGEGLYLGAQGRYAPESWFGWNIFGVGRVGMENMRAKRNVAILDYQRSNSKDWTGYSGTIRTGIGYDHNFESFSAGAFAALDYACMALPSFTEQNGLGSRLHLSSDTFHSLRSSVGTRMSTMPSTLSARTSWKLQGSVAWNHELLDKAGTLRASFADVARSGFTQRVELPGKDSLGLGAALIIDTDRDISFSLNAGSELAHGGSSLYGNLAVGWNF